jgi:uncharacterized membrane protein YcaP (DUF421 family)
MVQPFHLGDMHRLFLGESSAAFLLEVALRAALTYVGVLAVMRLLGPRVAGQFTLFEISVSVVVAAAIGVPLLSADRGLLPALVLVLTLVVLQRLIANIGFRHRRLQTLVSADLSTVVRDGVLDLDAMRRNALSAQAVFAQLRGAGHLQLGEISRVYVEPSGHFTIVANDPRPGLCLVPTHDAAMKDRMRQIGLACARCGAPGATDGEPCARCGSAERTPAVLAPETDDERH